MTSRGMCRKKTLNPQVVATVNHDRLKSFVVRQTERKNCFKLFLLKCDRHEMKEKCGESESDNKCIGSL